jgi:hypothetical protein
MAGGRSRNDIKTKLQNNRETNIRNKIREMTNILP